MLNRVKKPQNLQSVSLLTYNCYILFLKKKKSIIQLINFASSCSQGRYEANIVISRVLFLSLSKTIKNLKEVLQ